MPQTEQVPFRACLPFFMVTSLGFFISVFFLHLTQYASAISGFLSTCHNVFSATTESLLVRNSLSVELLSPLHVWLAWSDTVRIQKTLFHTFRGFFRCSGCLFVIFPDFLLEDSSFLAPGMPSLPFPLPSTIFASGSCP